VLRRLNANVFSLHTQTGLCAVISCTFNHLDSVKPNAAVWYKYPANGKREKDNHIIFQSKNPSEAQEGSKHRVSLLETDLTKGNCSVIINDIKENDAGQYQFRMIGGPFTDPQKITVTALTQEPSMLTPTLTEGKSATLTCTAPGICSGTPPHITWTWRGTGDNMTEEALTSVTTTHFSTLTFTPSAKYHGTKVTCLVTFNGSVTTKKTLKLNVTSKYCTLSDLVLQQKLSGQSEREAASHPKRIIRKVWMHCSSPNCSWMVGRSCSRRMCWYHSLYMAVFLGKIVSEPTPLAEKQPHT
uniref:Ig-like domain-containing protein n=1 Tax=Salmo trutta TaxID=8032 RepID=A0A674C9G3_SALTR